MRAAAAVLTFASLIALAASGCGGDSHSGSDSSGTLVAALGDSITSGSPGFDPDPAARAHYGFGDDERSSYEYWASKDEPSLEFRNCGVFGQSTDEIRARFAECTAGARALIVQGGINDIAQGAPVENAARHLREMVQMGKELDIPVAITDVLPWNNGYPQADPYIRELNRLIAGIAAEEGVPLLPFHDALEDPHAPGRMRPNLTADGDHPSVAGYRELGGLVAAQPGF